MDVDLFFRVFILAIVQGIAEFLPISSSGHLLVLGRFLEIPDVFTLTILLHLGTLFSVIVFFAAKLGDVLTRHFRAIWLVFLGTIPTVAIGLFVHERFPQIETSRLTAGVCFFVTALLLLTIMRRNSRTEDEEYYEKIACEEEGFEPPVIKTVENTTWWDAIVVGIAQGFAVLPGLSRSGATISAGVMRGMRNEWSAEFSFFLSIPVIAGGAILEIIEQVKAVGLENVGTLIQPDSNLLLYFFGALVSFAVGWISLFYLMQMLKAGKLHYFAFWLFLIGTATIVWTCVDHKEQVMGAVNSVWSFLQARFGGAGQ
ncbi:MAG: undecaprenyl-diphosphate phosphatase [Thermoguttaceae bacterium]|nr:undecaprenyl-diphosphate phosphatase [Thermoguttaceae bacterium]